MSETAGPKLKDQEQVLSYIDSLAEELLAKIADGKRYILGITGAPAAGKSTVSSLLKERINHLFGGVVAEVAPMDGFHKTNAELMQLGLWELKGIPTTFDAAGFLEKLQAIQDDTASVGWPTFDRSIEEPTPDGVSINASHKLVLVEGNYLLLDTEPWSQVSQYLDEIWYVDGDEETILPRLLERHIAGGKSPEAARAKVECTDLPNALLILQTKSNCDRIICLPLGPA